MLPTTVTQTLNGLLPFIAVFATASTSIFLAHLCSTSVIDDATTTHNDFLAVPHPISRTSKFEFSRDNSFVLTSSLQASSISYANALDINPIEHVVVFELRWKPMGQNLRLVIMHGSKFLDAKPVNGRAHLVLRPSLTKHLCDVSDTINTSSHSHRCSLTVSVLTDEYWHGGTTEFSLRAIRSEFLQPNKARLDLFEPDRPVQLSANVLRRNARLAISNSCLSATTISVIRKSSLIRRGLEQQRSTASVALNKQHPFIDLGPGMYFISVKSSQSCASHIELITESPKWAWTSFGRIFIITLLVILVTGPSVYICLAHHDTPGFNDTSIDTNEDEEIKHARRQKQILAAIAALDSFNFKKTDQFVGDDISCSICLEQYAESQSMRRLHCSHTFHTDCVVPWLMERGQCPLCRGSITTSTEDLQKSLASTVNSMAPTASFLASSHNTISMSNTREELDELAANQSRLLDDSCATLHSIEQPVLRRRRHSFA